MEMIESVLQVHALWSHVSSYIQKWMIPCKMHTLGPYFHSLSSASLALPGNILYLQHNMSEISILVTKHTRYQACSSIVGHGTTIKKKIY